MTQTTKLKKDLTRLGLSVVALRLAVKAESAAFAEALETPGSESLAQLHATHLVELDAVQRLFACMEALQRGRPDLFDA